MTSKKNTFEHFLNSMHMKDNPALCFVQTYTKTWNFTSN